MHQMSVRRTRSLEHADSGALFPLISGRKNETGGRGPGAEPYTRASLLFILWAIAQIAKLGIVITIFTKWECHRKIRSVILYTEHRPDLRSFENFHARNTPTTHLNLLVVVGS
ncbi:uncharacterized protein TrAFT101_001822 [Trichoderma asperellum]|uniref:uncharacterized protein n=1 Tax=Trichoderma asperellum TaxID=101201 RepID=UPI00332DD3C6|nr:hypothetical protein TrAFT101_001822 [Trichoderma asperellum]